MKTSFFKYISLNAAGLGLVLSGTAFSQPVRIGAAAQVPEHPSSRYNRYVNWRPGGGETVRLNPPRMSWPYAPDWPATWTAAEHMFTLQISSRPDCSHPVVDAISPFNFYNTLPELTGARTWYWRIGYDVGTSQERWSTVRSFTLSDDATVWDRSALARADFAKDGHPRVLFNRRNLPVIQSLARSDPASRAALAWMRERADSVMTEEWWKDFPKTDRAVAPRRGFYSIAGDLALVCFVWRMTDDVRYAGVKDRAVKWAAYPPGGRSSPEGLGGDGSEDASQGNEFLALLFDWLYVDLSEAERQTMIKSLTWRVDHIMNNFAWRSRREGDRVRPVSLSGYCSSHQYEASMDTAVCGLVLYEHSEVGRQWYELMLNYLMGVTCGFGFDEAWNEGPGYGTSKAKWLANASLYFDTTLPGADLGKNPLYRNVTEFFRRVIPVGMNHNAWGNQNNASRGNHLAHFRKFAYLTGDGQCLLNWQQYGGREFSSFRPWIEYVLPAYYQQPLPQPEQDSVRLFPIDGWAMAATGPPSLRSTFEDGVGVVFQSRPRGGYSHSFNSDGSFQLHAYGELLNHGGGSSANEDAYAYHTMSHNSVLVDGLGQAQQTSRSMAYPAFGRMVGFDRGKDHVYFAGDATRCYPGKPDNYSRWAFPAHPVYTERALPHLQRFIRHILFIRGKYFVIYDDLASTTPATYTWLYHILPSEPFAFDAATFSTNYRVGNVDVRLQHVAHADALTLDDRQGLDALMNPMTGEDYREYRKGDILCGHNLWVSNAKPTLEWEFLTVVYPVRQGERIPAITRIDDRTVRVGEDVITFNPADAKRVGADFVVDVAAFRGQK